MQISQHVITAVSLSDVDYRHLLARILWKRSGEFLSILFMLAVPMENVMRMAVAAYMGFVGAVMICLWTMHAGVWGIWYYFCINFPQGLQYFLIGYLILWRLPLAGKKLTVGTVCILILILCTGIAAETYINPYVLSFLFNF